MYVDHDRTTMSKIQSSVNREYGGIVEAYREDVLLHWVFGSSILKPSLRAKILSIITEY